MLLPARLSTRWRPFLAPLITYTLMWAVMTWPQVLSWRLVGDLYDPLGKMWQLGWVAGALAHDPSRLFDGNIFYPATMTLAYSDTMLVPSLLSAPLIWLGVPVAFVFNLLLATGFVGSGLTMFLLARRVTGSVHAAWVSGAAFAFLPYRFSHYPHLELQLTMWMPLVLWALHRTIASGRWRDGLMTGLFLGLQLLSSLYYGVYFGVVLVPLALIMLAGAPRPIKTLGTLAAAAVLAAALVSPVVAAHARARTEVGVRLRADVVQYSARVSDYLRPNVGNRTYRSLAAGATNGERRLFPGFLLLGLAAIGVWPSQRRAWLACLIGGVVAFDASRGLHGTVYPLLWNHVDAFGGFRVPARFGLITAMMLAVLAGWGVVRLMGWTRDPRWRAVVVAVLLSGVLVDSRTFPLPLGSLPRRIPDVYAWLAEQPPLVAVELPVDDAADFGYMYQAGTHGQRIMNGQSGFSPPWYAELRAVGAAFPSDHALRFLRERGATHVVLHRSLLGADRHAEISEQLGRRSDVRRVFVTPLGHPQADVWLIASTKP